MRPAAALLFVLLAMPALADDKPDPKAAAAIQNCVKAKTSTGMAESCIGIVSGPCLDRDATKSTADMNACVSVEQTVWDGVLNDTYARLRDKLDNDQQDKLRDMQRARITSRQKTCAFYWDYFQGTMASPMSAECADRETAQRALFLLFFLNEADGK
jgi:uncharacterized protein YecT (DUF1311 family)